MQGTSARRDGQLEWDGPLDPVGTAAVLACSLCWGAVPVLLRYLTSVVDAWTANGFRYPLSAVLFWPVLYAGWRAGHVNVQLVRRCLVPALLALGGQVLWALAPYYLGASLVGFFVRFSVVWSLLAAMILFRDERRLLVVRRFHVGILLSATGLVLLSLSRSHDPLRVHLAGLAIILGCGAFFGLYAVSVRVWIGELDPLIGFGMVSQIVSLGTLIGLVGMGHPSVLLRVPAAGWLALVVSSVLGIAMGHVFLYTAVRRLGAALTSGVLALTPFVTAVLASLLLQERLTLRQWFAGGAMVVGAAALLSAQSALAIVRDR